jgi:hypothetical protein
MLAERKGEDRFFVSDNNAGFASLASVFLNEDIQGMVQTAVL